MSKFLAKFLYILMGLTLALTLVGCSDNLTPLNVADQYLKNEVSGNFTTNYDLLTTDSQLKIGRNEYAVRLNQAKQDAGIVSITITRILDNPTVVGNRASVPYQLEIALQSGQKMSIFESLVMLRQESGWRVVWPPA